MDKQKDLASKDEREELVQQLEEARRTLFALIDQFDQSDKVYPEWTIKQLLAHLAGWDDMVIEMLRAVGEDRPPSTRSVRGIDYYNAQSVAERETLDLNHIRKECERTREEVKRLLREFPLEKLNEEIVYPWGAKGSIARFIQVFIHHEGVEHADDLRQLLNA